VRVVVTGGRHYADRALVFAALDRIHAESPITLLVHGACGWNADDASTFERDIEGADGLADAWAIARGVPFERVPARWTTLGYAAGPIRNRHMLDEWKPSLVLAFPGNRGTAGCVREAMRRRIPVEHAARKDAGES
jgi:hypothetical protein